MVEEAEDGISSEELIKDIKAATERKNGLPVLRMDRLKVNGIITLPSDIPGFYVTGEVIAGGIGEGCKVVAGGSVTLEGDEATANIGRKAKVVAGCETEATVKVPGKIMARALVVNQRGQVIAAAEKIDPTAEVYDTKRSSSAEITAAVERAIKGGIVIPPATTMTR